MMTASATVLTGETVDLSGDGGVTRQMTREGAGKGLVTGDIATVKFTGTVEDTGQVRDRMVHANTYVFDPIYSI